MHGVPLIALVGLAVGCSSPAPQVLTGRIAPGFPSTIATVKMTTSSVRSWHGDAVVTTARVASDGSFRIEVPPMTGLRIQLLADAGRTAVVFPRRVGSVATSFAIRPNGVEFDLGMVHYVGDSSSTVYAFKTGGGTSDTSCNDDGKDVNGATCVDDTDSIQDTCGQNDNNQQDGDHQDGEGSAQDGEHSDPNDGADTGDAVAEHNFPADGCADGQDGHQDESNGNGNN